MNNGINNDTICVNGSLQNYTLRNTKNNQEYSYRNIQTQQHMHSTKYININTSIDTSPFNISLDNRLNNTYNNQDI